MSKEYTSYLKGVAILLMVCLHLFKPSNDIYELGNIFSIGGVPLVGYLTRMCNPVPFFLILSGYGLYAVYGKLGGVNPLKRVVNLYVHLWVIYLIFVPLGSLVRPEMYPGSTWTFIKNATSWQCSYIGEQWFFLPYILLMLFSKWIFVLFDKMKSVWVLVISVVIYMGTVAALKYVGESTLGENMLLYNPFLALYMLLPFALGYLAKRDCWMERLAASFEKMHLRKNWIIIVIMVLVCTVRCFISHQAVDPIYAIVFVLLFSMVTVGNIPGKTLTFLGKHSMNIWLIHTWICIRLFHEFVYGLHYPVLIYIFVLVASIFVSVVVESVYGVLDRTFLSKLRKA